MVPRSEFEEFPENPIGPVKVSYRGAVDILGKVAGYINTLFELGIKERQVYLTTIWYENGTMERPISGGATEVLSRNPYVRGLFSLSLSISGTLTWTIVFVALGTR
jgi:hypothetical protein